MRVIFQIKYDEEKAPSDIEVYEIDYVSLAEKINPETEEHTYDISFSNSNDELFIFSFDNYDVPFALVKKAYETGLLNLASYEPSNYIEYGYEDEENDGDEA